MNLLNKLTVKNLKLNKKRTIVTIIGIVLSIALLTAVSSFYTSGINSLIEYEKYLTGNYHVKFENVSEEDLESLKLNENFEFISAMKDIGYSKINSNNENKPYILVKGYTKESFNQLGVRLIDGRLPENDSEVLIPTHLYTNGRVKYEIGDKIKLNLGKRYINGEVVNQNAPYEKEEIFKAEEEKEYTVVGRIQRSITKVEPYSAPGYTLITLLPEVKKDDSLDLYIRFKKDRLKDYYKSIALIEGFDPDLFARATDTSKLSDFTEEEEAKLDEQYENRKYDFVLNQYLAEFEKNPLTGSAMGDMGRVVMLVLAIIVVSSVFCIRNSFDISITEKIKQYGMLRSVGATKKQIRKNVLYEATVLGLIGIPLGIILGLVATIILMIITNALMDGMLGDGLTLKFVFSWIAVIASIILGFITIYLSALKSAFKASHVSPIESIRNSANIKIKRKSLKVPKIISKIFKIGGEISYKNIKRNKRKFRTTVISIIMSVSVFIGLTSFMNIAMSSVKDEIKNADYTISVSIDNPLDKTLQKYRNFKNVSNVDKVSIMKTDYMFLDNVSFSDDYKRIEKDNVEYQDTYVQVKVLDNDSFNEYLKSLKLDPDDYKDKGILNNIVLKYDNGKKVRINTFNTKEGDSIKNRIEVEGDKDFSIKIGKITYDRPFGEANNIAQPLLIMNYDLYKNTFNKKFDNIKIYINSSDSKTSQDELEKLLNDEGYSLENIEETVRQMNNIILLVGIFLYGFITVITLIGVTNIFNTINSNISLRRQEFAMLKSIGMTKKEFNNMIRLESIFIGIKSLVFGIPGGIGISLLVYKSFDVGSAIPYQVPLNAIIISVVAVFLLISIIMSYSVKKCDNQNIIETIRNENI